MIRGWIAELGRVNLAAEKGNELPAAKQLIEQAEAERKHPSDRTHLVDYVVAVTLLNRYMQAGPASKTDAAEALYLMGIAEARITRSYWVSDTEFLLDQAIRTAPKSEVAKEAYAFLTEYTVSAEAERFHSHPGRRFP